MAAEDLRYWFALKFVEGVGNVSFRQIVDAAGSPRDAFAAAPERLAALIGARAAQNIKDFRDWEKADREVELACSSGVSVYRYIDPQYPKGLRNIYDFPPLLYVRGEIRADDINVAVVGSRAASAYGKHVTGRLCRGLALNGVTVVSGLARGIDAEAHRAALAAGGRTIAVLGCGIDVIYPAVNRDLYASIPGSGAIVTEFPFGAPPEARHFPARNRIISGLSLGVVIVEATEKSGSLITARTALDQGREVFAVPGIIDAPGSKGTHMLLRQGAKLVEDVNDIIEEILPQIDAGNLWPDRAPQRDQGPKTRPQIRATRPADASALSAGEKALIEVMSADPQDVDTIIALSGRPAGEILGMLTGLELRGYVEQLPGRMFALK
jgi:DNA processing protein